MFALAATVPGTAFAEPSVGARMPSFRVNDLTGSTRTERDLVGGWSVVFAMTDKDVGPDLTAWWRRVEAAVPQGTRMYTFVALDLFPLIPTDTIVSQARDSTPRSRWNTVWLSRDGSFARSLGLPEVEMPWVFVIDPGGRVAAALHERVSAAGLNRVIAALNPAP
ncbi:MAG: hypothetical protein R3A48_05310 [Polyangiales bacterium]